MARAHAAGLAVHPYTSRVERDQIPAYAKDYTDLLNSFLFQIGVDGVFTDFTDKASNTGALRTRFRSLQRRLRPWERFL